MASLSQSLSKCRYLRQLNLSSNELSSKGLDMILDRLLLTKDVHIENLSIAKIRIDDAALLPLFGALENNRLPALKYLDIGHNQLGNDAGEAIGRLLETNNSVETLRLQWNKFRLQGAEALASGLV